jgi:hypothetical protein
VGFWGIESQIVSREKYREGTDDKEDRESRVIPRNGK